LSEVGPVREPSVSDKTVTLHRLLRLLCFGALLVPAAVLVVCYVLSALNENAGWHRYPLPILLLFVYLLSALASPVVGISALVVLYIRRRASGVKVRSDESPTLRTQVVVLSLLDIFAFLIWALQLPYVLFSAGGSR
jgi:hypothetical protein